MNTSNSCRHGRLSALLAVAATALSWRSSPVAATTGPRRLRPGAPPPAHQGTHASPQIHADSGHEFQYEMRKLWEDHVTWTRLAIVSFVDDLPDLKPTVAGC